MNRNQRKRDRLTIHRLYGQAAEQARVRQKVKIRKRKWKRAEEIERSRRERRQAMKEAR